MMKIKFLFSILFVVAFQVTFAFSPTEMESISMTMGIESENQIQFEEDHFSPGLFCEGASGHGSITLIVSVTKLLFSKSNNHQMAVTQGILQATKVHQTTLHLGLATYSILLIPSFLQTGNLQI